MAIAAMGRLPRKATCPDWCRGHGVDECEPDGYDGMCEGEHFGTIETYAETDTSNAFVDADGLMIELERLAGVARLTAADARTLGLRLVRMALELKQAADWVEAHS